MITIIISAIKIIVLLGLLIIIHEAGHMIVAKKCKVKVNEFSIGFGPIIWKKQGKETKYTLRLIPLGGFCSMEGEDERSENEGSFSKASIPRRLAIVFAGALVNIIFGLLVFFILMASTGNYISNEIENTIDGYVAEEIGLQPGDKIVEIEGKEVKSKYDLDDVTKNITENREISLKIDRNGEIIEYKTKLTEVASKVTGLYLDEKGKVITVEKGSVAEKQGIQANDKIIKINNENVNEDITKIVEQIQQKGVGTVLLTIERGDETLNIELTPDHEYSYYLGVNLKIAENTIINHIIYGAVETKEFSLSIIDNLKQLFTGKVGIDQMMGPVGISEAVAKTTGIEDFVFMLALISLSLGVTNLLPIPALDGGKILILLIEAIRRKPLKQETELNIQLLGFSFLIVLSLYVAYNDILRIF
mgnify:FL=1